MSENFIEFNEDRLRRFFEGNYTEEDKAWVIKIFCDKSVEAELKKYLRKHWYELFQEVEATEKNLDHILYQLHYEINTKQEIPRRRVSKFINSFSRIAAVLILPLLVYMGISLYRNSDKENGTWVEIKAPGWTRAQFMLPDSTSVWLNSNSTIKYRSNYIRNREVIIKGEAFFDVTENKGRPFKVLADEVVVTVLGTKFNIASYEDENDIEVVLEEGKLVFTDKSRQQSYVMKPYELIVYNKERKDFSVETVQAEKYSSWLEGKLIFRNDPLDVIARRLERWYNVKVETSGEFKEDIRLRATFVDENIEEVLYFMKRSLPIDYLIQEGGINDDGVYYKKRIIITPRKTSK